MAPAVEALGGAPPALEQALAAARAALKQQTAATPEGSPNARNPRRASERSREICVGVWPAEKCIISPSNIVISCFKPAEASISMRCTIVSRRIIIQLVGMWV